MYLENVENTLQNKEGIRVEIPLQSKGNDFLMYDEPVSHFLIRKEIFPHKFLISAEKTIFEYQCAIFWCTSSTGNLVSFSEDETGESQYSTVYKYKNKFYTVY